MAGKTTSYRLLSYIILIALATFSFSQFIHYLIVADDLFWVSFILVVFIGIYDFDLLKIVN